ncbi:MAG TPA: endonuclease MutS2 [Saprospiraceae bacterium]|nr:endonuclease MutS2 [Saprospiraceae bacterium]
MQFEPKDLFEKLEFDKIIDLTVKECLGELGVAAVQAIRPSTDLAKIRQSLSEVAEMRLSIEENDHFPGAAYQEINEELKMLDISGYVLAEEGLQRINTILIQTRDIFSFFKPEKRELYPHLYQIIQSVTFDESLIKEIEKVIDEEGNIRPDASPELARIRRAINSKQRELDRVFRGIIQQYRGKGMLTDNVESFRNGRRVLSVPAEYKRQVRGIIHDESASGKTTFIEPEKVIDINNDIFDLHQKEKREIYRILKELSALLRPYIPLMRIYQGLLVRFDVVRAKARLAVRIKGEQPTLQEKPTFKIIQGYHPLLLLKNKQYAKKTVPFTLDLHKPNRLLMLSGPNAGGKSITLKSVGLIQLMVQSGFLVPVDPISKLGIFEQFFADIGDQQSLEDDLSTYSSHLKNMQTFLKSANDKTLVLIDEFGSGTDPAIGGAIAEAILREMNFKEIFGVVTTHYSNLKIFAFKAKGIVNASMHFDTDTLSPTYELKVGKPGSSYAYEIAEKSGLPKGVLKNAKDRSGKKTKAVDELLVELQREKQQASEQLESLKDKEVKLERLIKTYENLHRDLEYRRKRMKMESKETELQEVARFNKEFEQIIREIKEEKNLEKAKEKAKEIREKREEVSRDVKKLREDIYYKPNKNKQSRPIKEGDFVKMKTGGSTGTVETIDKTVATVQMGIMRMKIKLHDLQLADQPLEVKKTKSVHTRGLTQTANFQSKIDIRGMRFEEALQVVEEFVDQALMTNASNLEIVHGKGSGVLRKAVRKKLKEYNVDMDVRHPAPEQGGDGVTLIDIS